MKGLKKITLVLTLVLSLPILMTHSLIATAATPTPAWKVDTYMRFQVAYLPTPQLLNLSGQDVKNIPSLDLSKPYLPDIVNINLANFLKLGFQVPAPTPTNQYNVFLKLYEFPQTFNAANTTTPLLKAFYFNKLKTGKALLKYASNSKNDVVKFTYIDKSNTPFTQEHPFPFFQIKTNANFQNIFNEHLPFASLYVAPLDNPHGKMTPDAQAAQSTQGLLNFYKEILKVYRSNLIEIYGEDGQYWYFIDKNNATEKTITLLKLPKKPLIFDNWRDLPMPHDLKRFFLSGLLLIYKTTYQVVPEHFELNTKPLPRVDSTKFNQMFINPNTQVMEVGSIVYFKKNLGKTLKQGTPTP